MNNYEKDFNVREDEILVEVMDEVARLRIGCGAVRCEDDKQKQQNGHLWKWEFNNLLPVISRRKTKAN